MNETSEKLEKQHSRGLARRRAMMDAAWALLLERGFAGVTLNDVISKSGGSRTTLYEAFGGKDGLLAAVMTERCKEFSAELHISLETDLPPRDALTDFATRLARKILTDEAARFTKILFTEGHHFMPLVEQFMKIGPDSTRGRLTRYLKRQHDLGRIHVEDPEQYAELLESLIYGSWHKHILRLGEPPEMSEAEVAAHVKRLVDLFLCGVSTSDYRDSSDNACK